MAEGGGQLSPSLQDQYIAGGPVPALVDFYEFHVSIRDFSLAALSGALRLVTVWKQFQLKYPAETRRCRGSEHASLVDLLQGHARCP